MDHPLASRTVTRRERDVRIEGRVLYLTEDPELLRRQLDGEDLDWDPSIPLRNDISTDEITPGWVCYYHDETLGEFPYVGLTCEGEQPVARRAVLDPSPRVLSRVPPQGHASLPIASDAFGSTPRL